ncbi:MAG: hypothetical protein ACRDJC_13255 [Thermomicrobiales bacterium]
MESDRFDAITRLLTLGASRRGLTASLAVLAAAGSAEIDDAEVKKKRRKKQRKRCKTVERSCSRSRDCCGSLLCQEKPGCQATGKYCCASVHGSCADDCQCCSGFGCQESIAMCCAGLGGPCDSSEDCCGALLCVAQTCA